ncbi:unnamed protein product [Trichobilharzia regenti]|nr:unnamed protein product [Trichobilharzia regenti]
MPPSMAMKASQINYPAQKTQPHQKNCMLMKEHGAKQKQNYAVSEENTIVINKADTTYIGLNLQSNGVEHTYINSSAIA